VLYFKKRYWEAQTKKILQHHYSMVLIALLASSGTTHSQISKCEKARDMLDEALVQYEVVDGMDPEASDARNLLFKLSKQFANYPLFFYEFGLEGEIKFLGVYEELELLWYNNLIPNEGNIHSNGSGSQIVTFQDSSTFLNEIRRKQASLEQKDAVAESSLAFSPIRKTRLMLAANTRGTISSGELRTMSPTKSRITKKVRQLESSRTAKFDTGVVPYDLSPKKKQSLQQTQQSASSNRLSSPRIVSTKLPNFFSSPNSNISSITPTRRVKLLQTLPKVPSLASATLVYQSCADVCVTPVKQKSIKGSMTASMFSPSKSLRLAKDTISSLAISPTTRYQELVEHDTISAGTMTIPHNSEQKQNEDDGNKPIESGVDKKSVNRNLRPCVVRGQSFDENNFDNELGLMTNNVNQGDNKVNSVNKTTTAIQKRGSTKIVHPGDGLGASLDVNLDEKNTKKTDNSSLRKKNISLRPCMVRGASFDSDDDDDDDDEIVVQPKKKNEQQQRTICLRPGLVHVATFASVSDDDDEDIVVQSKKKTEQQRSTTISLRPDMVRGASFDSDTGIIDKRKSTISLRPGMERGTSIESDNDFFNPKSSEQRKNTISLRPGIVRGTSFDSDDTNIVNAKNEDTASKRSCSLRPSTTRGGSVDSYDDEEEEENIPQTKTKSTISLRPGMVRGTSIDSDDNFFKPIITNKERHVGETMSTAADGIVPITKEQSSRQLRTTQTKETNHCLKDFCQRSMASMHSSDRSDPVGEDFDETNPVVGSNSALPIVDGFTRKTFNKDCVSNDNYGGKRVHAVGDDNPKSITSQFKETTAISNDDRSDNSSDWEAQFMASMTRPGIVRGRSNDGLVRHDKSPNAQEEDLTQEEGKGADENSDWEAQFIASMNRPGMVRGRSNDGLEAYVPPEEQQQPESTRKEEDSDSDWEEQFMASMTRPGMIRGRSNDGLEFNIPSTKPIEKDQHNDDRQKDDSDCILVNASIIQREMVHGRSDDKTDCYLQQTTTQKDERSPSQTKHKKKLIGKKSVTYGDTNNDCSDESTVSTRSDPCLRYNRPTTVHNSHHMDQSRVRDVPTVEGCGGEDEKVDDQQESVQEESVKLSLASKVIEENLSTTGEMKKQ
jgi:hypothetical protein